MSKFLRLSFFALSAVGPSLIAGCAHDAGAQGPIRAVVVESAPTGITVTGEGKADGRPDVAVFQVGVEARRPTIEEARSAAAAAQTAVLAALEESGIAEKDIRTTQLNLQPDYEYSESGRKLRGYIASNMVEVRARDLDSVGATIDRAAKAGGDLTQLMGLRFELEDPTAIKARAREQAIARARAQAEQVASLLGVRLGAPIAVEEASGAPPPVPMMMAREVADTTAGGATPVRAGTLEVEVRLQVRWAIER